ncbi:hypothetical protein RR46_08428 [Papilio xuthus]|uniref:Uncharacterized protein n=1 Tax=Papilio xuthus TaxID=66420 RepID=A0A194PFE2_PAPXU|nr:hypothetical protein RR46_08428 [Papilio xuthus]
MSTDSVVIDVCPTPPPPPVNSPPPLMDGYPLPSPPEIPFPFRRRANGSRKLKSKIVFGLFLLLVLVFCYKVLFKSVSCTATCEAIIRNGDVAVGDRSEFKKPMVWACNRACGGKKEGSQFDVNNGETTSIVSTTFINEVYQLYDCMINIFAKKPLRGTRVNDTPATTRISN